MNHKETSYSVYWPGGARTQKPTDVAPKLSGLAGKRVAFLWDYMFRGDEIFAILAQALKQRFPDVSFIGHEEFGSTHSSNERQMLAELPARLKALRVDAVVSAVGC